VPYSRPLSQIRRQERRLALILLVVAVLAAAAAAAAGWMTGAAVAPDPRVEAPDRRAELGPLRIAVTGEWLPARRAPGVDGLDPDRTAVFATAPPLPAHVVVTLGDPQDTALVPAPLRSLLRAELPEPRRTMLLGRPAWRYPELPAVGGRLVDYTVVPTTDGALTIACLGTTAAWSAAVGCSSGIRVLSLEGAEWLAPSPELAFQRRAPAVLDRLARARLDGRRALARARTRRGQAVRARRLAAAYRHAAGTLAPLAAGGGSELLVRSLRRTTLAYGALATAAARRPGRYRAARREVTAAEAGVDRSLRELHADGARPG
jgi:hypothetical protein